MEAPPNHLQPPRRFLVCTMRITLPSIECNLEPRFPEVPSVYRGITVLIALSRELCL